MRGAVCEEHPRLQVGQVCELEPLAAVGGAGKVHEGGGRLSTIVE